MTTERMEMKHMSNMDNIEKLEASALSFGAVFVVTLILKTFRRLPKVTLCNICLANTPRPPPPNVSPFTSPLKILRS